jgi:single-strand DNA-binding protein
MRVIASGRLKSRSYDTKEGEKRTVIELEIDEIGPSLTFATAKVQRKARGGNGGGQAQGGFGGGQQGQGSQGGGGWGGNQPAAQADPWATPGVANAGGWGNGPDSEPPF